MALAHFPHIAFRLERVEKLEERQSKWLNCCCDEQTTLSD
jgi:hypothetical protein